ncbi:MAG: cytochrome c oxidase subunit I, partial [Leeuwenhoekiella sp.]
LEWTTEHEHIHGNWEGAIPHVYRWAYDYSKLNEDEDDYVIAGQDYVPQNIPLQENEEEMNH